MSLWDKLPTDIIQHIYEYDTTYREKMNESLKFIDYAYPTCCCDGGKKTLYRHYGSTYNIIDSVFYWEWRRKNACSKHNPNEFDKNGFQCAYDFIDEMVEQTRYIISLRTDEFWADITNYESVILHYEIRTGRTWWRELSGIVNYNLIMLSLWVFCTRNKDIYPSPIKTYSRKTLTGARFMDMTHAQRPIAV